MPEVVSAVLVPDVQFLMENAAELGAVLGVRLGAAEAQAGRKQCEAGVLVHALKPGNESLGVKFFNWTRPEGKLYSVGVLKPAGDIREFVTGRQIAEDEAVNDAISVRILINVENFRAAVGG